MTDTPAFIGIDPTAGKRPVTYAVLDAKLRVEKLRTVPLEDALADILDYPQAVCGIDAPGGRNRGLLANPEYRARLGLKPRRDKYSMYRVCEYELRRRGIAIYNTPPEEERLPGWMRTGFDLYGRLRAAGYVDWPQSGSRRLFETYPHAAFTLMVSGRLYKKTSIQGLLQRQLLLYDEGVDVPDPVRVLEEWTRHHLRTGHLQLDQVHSHDELDALAAAYTAYLAAREPGNVTAVGDPSEGQIVLPVGGLPDTR